MSPAPAEVPAPHHHRFAAPALMVGAALLFSGMGVCVKLASSLYSAGEMVFYRGLVGMVVIGLLVRWQGGTLRTPVPGMHVWRSVVGVVSLGLWFFAIGGLPLATAVTLNYMSSVWMALFVLGGAVLTGTGRLDGRLVMAVMAGFAGVVLVLRPSMQPEQVWFGLAGLASGVLAAMAYLQVTALGRVGEPETRIVFYFSMGSVVCGGASLLVAGMRPHSAVGLLLLLAIGLLATSAQMMMTRAYAIGRMLSNATLQYLGILFSFLWGVFLFGDPVTLSALSGILLIVAAGLSATLLRARQDRSPDLHEA